MTVKKHKMYEAIFNGRNLYHSLYDEYKNPSNEKMRIWQQLHITMGHSCNANITKFYGYSVIKVLTANSQVFTAGCYTYDEYGNKKDFVVFTKSGVYLRNLKTDKITINSPIN